MKAVRSIRSPSKNEKSVMASLDYANLSEYVSFGTVDFNKIVDGLIAKQK